MKKRVGLNKMVRLLKTIAEENHLRILTLLYHEDLTVSDIIFVLGQSQSYIIRHIRLLCKARLIEHYKKGGRVYFRLCHGWVEKNIVMVVLSTLSESDLMLAYDLSCLMKVREQHKKRDKKIFLQKTAQWDKLRLPYIADHIIENTLLEIVGDKPFETMLGIGIGVGSVLKLFSRLYTRAIEVVLNSSILHLSVGDETFDLVILHGALHFLENPEMALHEVTHVLRPHGRLLIVDFVQYKDKSLHSSNVDVYPKFSDLQIEQWLKNVGLILEKTICIAPTQSENDEQLMMTFWLARDPRLLIDDIKNKKVEFA
ncbi:ArsR family transcriptional regulator [Bartonella japonica]|uniref:ArsR family transcriptional regulator n=1 Tax=Bartonella japonica TaxID=357761 RepID=A0ABV2FMM8_9HYPH